MNFEEFQNQSRLYVIGALEPEELEEFERERKKSGKRASHNVTHYVRHSLLVCVRRKLSPQSKNGSRRWCENGNRYIADCVWLAVPQATEWQGIGDQIRRRVYPCAAVLRKRVASWCSFLHPRRRFNSRACSATCAQGCQEARR
jgi:hypothetical protein